KRKNGKKRAAFHVRENSSRFVQMLFQHFEHIGQNLKAQGSAKAVYRNFLRRCCASNKKVRFATHALRDRDAVNVLHENFDRRRSLQASYGRGIAVRGSSELIDTLQATWILRISDRLCWNEVFVQ